MKTFNFSGYTFASDSMGTRIDRKYINQSGYFKNIYAPVDEQPVDDSGKVLGPLKELSIWHPLSVGDRVRMLNDKGSITRSIDSNWVYVIWDKFPGKEIKEWTQNLRHCC